MLIAAPASFVLHPGSANPIGGQTAAIKRWAAGSSS
jgi:hypothetical protein